jgi:Zn-dependent protease
MLSSLKLGKLFGIDLYVHGTFWLLPLFVFFGGALSGGAASAAFDVAVLLAVFGCVALHEVGHAVAAKAFGVRTRDITLYPIGGVASLERMPERPLHEIVIALAGPAVNVVIAAGLFAVVAVGSALPGWFSSGPDLADVFIARLFWANVFLAGFNLLPAFPMDGGRVLRAVLSLGMNRLSATKVAATVGAVIAAAFILVGLFPQYILDTGTPHLGLVVLGVVVFLLGQAELAAVRVQEARRGWGRLWDPLGEEIAERPRAEPEPFTGWRYDPARRVWTQWYHGEPIRDVHV